MAKNGIPIGEEEFKGGVDQSFEQRAASILEQESKGVRATVTEARLNQLISERQSEGASKPSIPKMVSEVNDEW